METKFEAIIDSWINGQRKQCARQFEALSENERHNFKSWFLDYWSDSTSQDCDLVRLLLFLLIR